MTLSRAERAAFIAFADQTGSPQPSNVMTGDAALNYMIAAGGS